MHGLFWNFFKVFSSKCTKEAVKMKKTLFLLLLFAFIFTLVSCVLTYKLEDPIHEDKKELSEKEGKVEILGVQYIRTDGYVELFEYPRLIIVTSRDELQAYYNHFSGIYYLDARETVYSDSTIGWITACEKYDEEFFKNNDLYMAVLEEGSGSIRHSVEGIDNGSVFVKSVIPEVCTDDMAEWHILIEVEKGAEISQINGKTVSVTTPDEIYEKFLKILENTATEYLKNEYEIEDAVLKFTEKTDFGSVKNLGFHNPLGYSPGYDASPVWKMDFLKSDGSFFTLLVCDSPFVFGTVGLE